MNQKNKLYTLKNIGDLKNCRIYNELEVTPIQAFYSELEVYFNQCINQGYNIYVLNNKPTHNIIFTKNDINYISADPYEHAKEVVDYYSSSNLKYIKELQLNDYKWILCYNKFDFVFFIPNLDKNNKYYYNFIVAVKNNDRINDILNHKFNLIELNNLQYLNQFLFDITFLEKLFNIENISNDNATTTIFKDNLLTANEWGLCQNSDGKDFLYKNYIDFCLKKLCFHFYYDSSIKKFGAFTNFLELTNGIVAIKTENGIKAESMPYPLPFLDLIEQNNEFLFFIDQEIEKFHWNELNYERDHLLFLSYRIKNITWGKLFINEYTKDVEKAIKEYQERLEQEKNEIKAYKIRLRGYRRLLKNHNKNKIK